MPKANSTPTTKRRRLPHRPGETAIFYAGPLGPNGEVPPLPDGAQLLVGRELPPNVVLFPTARVRRARREFTRRQEFLQRIAAELRSLEMESV